ncbi:MAG: hypothetical protein RLZZ429_124 [Bacteroidota bacterium]|jgi:hypothetical protein
MPKHSITASQQKELLIILHTRFQKNEYRHKEIDWKKVLIKLEAQPAKLWSLHEMEKTGGEPDVIAYDKKTDTYLFVDCAAESPAGRRSVCYDREGLESRKEHAPKNSAMDMAQAMGIELLTEEQYRLLQSLQPVDRKTSSWLLTPAAIRKEGGAIFGDYRYGQVFIYHNGAQSYYAARGFRGVLKL